MNGVGTIYYLIPNIQERDYSPVKLAKAILRGDGSRHLKRYWCSTHKPVGGVKVIFQHCMILQALGYRAMPLQMGAYAGNFYGYPIKTRHIRDVGYRLKPNDVVVVPEFMPQLGSKFDCGARILFAQNWCHLYRESDVPDFDTSYADMGYDHILICSEFIRGKLCRERPDRIHLINNYIDFDKFKPNKPLRQPGRVMALPRKQTADLKRIMELLEPDKPNFCLVDGVPESQIISEYQQADIFLATGYPEGFGLPPLEAMACGAAVVGFTGGGAKEYMIDQQTALVADDGDVEAAAWNLKRLLSDDALKERLRESAKAVATRYTIKRTTEQLANFMSNLEVAHLNREQNSTIAITTDHAITE